MQKKLNLSSEKILDKRFNIDFKGYSGQEVDEFLDEVIQDYDTYNEIINELSKVLHEYESKIEVLQQENQKLKNNIAATPKTSEITSFNQLEVLKRLARLEAAVFKK